jgi:hypothetical protein
LTDHNQHEGYDCLVISSNVIIGVLLAFLFAVFLSFSGGYWYASNKQEKEIASGIRLLNEKINHVVKYNAAIDSTLTYQYQLQVKLNSIADKLPMEWKVIRGK